MNGTIWNGFGAIKVYKKAAKSGENCFFSKLPHPLHVFLSNYRDLCLPLKIAVGAFN